MTIPSWLIVLSKRNNTLMIIPHTELASDTLQALIEEFATREGTEYGELDFPLEKKVEQIIQQLERKEIYIVYSELHETCTLITKDTL